MKHVHRVNNKTLLTERFHIFFYKQLFDTVRSFHYYFSPAGMYVFKSKIETLDWYAE